MTVFFKRQALALAALDSLDDALFVFSQNVMPEYVNAAGRKMLNDFLNESFLGFLQQEAGRRLIAASKQESVDEGSDGESVEISAERVDGRREPLFSSFSLARVGARNYVVVALRRHPRLETLSKQRDQVLQDLEQSREASLNIMEDLLRQKAQLESANHALEEEIAVRKRTEEARDRVAAIVESSDDAIFSCSLQGVVTSWNKAAERMYGYTAREILGRDSICLVPEAELGAQQLLHEKIARGERVVSIDTKRATRSGKTLDVSITWSALFDLRERLAGYSVISRDITERIAIERELQKYREQLERLVVERTGELVRAREKAHQAERLASIGALAAGIAHEINNPIGAMLLAAQNALESRESLHDVAELSEALERFGKKVVSNAERCGVIVRGVLQFARKQRTETWPSDINEIVRNSIQLVRESGRMQNASIHSDLTAGLPMLKVNPIELEQVVVNLVKNACQSGDAAVTVRVTTKRTSTGVQIAVGDNGRGIPESERARIFDPFFTTRLERGGTGLGLSIVHGIVSSYDGTIDVESEVGKGTCMVVNLPFQGRRERPAVEELPKRTPSTAGTS